MVESQTIVQHCEYHHISPDTKPRFLEWESFSDCAFS